jgi:hypothetical protein
MPPLYRTEDLNLFDFMLRLAYMKIISETHEPSGEWISIGKDGSKSLGPMGEIITTEYECPCGKGKIVATFEDIPGYRESYASIECEECNKIYNVTYNWAWKDDEPVLKKNL